jgi:predicted regulator of Ras-like GTPase activity (Roadblock/LC7/MglB family)
MQALLESLNSVPGVLGGMVCAPEGHVVARAFPASFDDDLLGEAASVLADGCVGLDTVTGPLGLIDLRYAEARVVAKPIVNGLLLLLCSRSVNLQLLLISIAATSKKIEKLLAEAPELAVTEEVAEEPGAAGAAAEASPAEGGKKKTKKNWWPSV